MPDLTELGKPKSPFIDPVLWRDATTDPPPEGILVETISPGRMRQQLFRNGRLWFVPDGKMYVYYTPHKWKPLDSQP